MACLRNLLRSFIIRSSLFQDDLKITLKDIWLIWFITEKRLHHDYQVKGGSQFLVT